MIYFLTALYCEAKDIIDHYKMKKVMDITKFQVFRGENQVLIISGAGGIKAAVAAAYLLNYFQYSESDIFVNVGVCGGCHEKAIEGEVLLCNKLIQFSNRTFYPEMLFRHPFREGRLKSYPEVVCEKREQSLEADIVDQEGAFVYEAASIFLKPEKIYIIKVVSDMLSPSSVTPQHIEHLLAEKMTEVYAWLEECVKAKLEEEDIILQEEYKMLEILAEKMKMSLAMDMEFRKLATQFKIRNGYIKDLLYEYIGIQCSSKNEGKIIYGELKKRLMEL